MQSRWRRRITALLFFVPCLMICAPNTVFGAQLTFVSDLISDSAVAGTTTVHTVNFTVGTGIPPSGKISIIPEQNGAGSFTVDPALSVADLTLQVSSGGGPYTSRSLAAAQSGVDDGVTITSGVNGNIVITLASGVPGILAGDSVKLVIGASSYITSPSIQGSYRVRIRTYDAGSVEKDVGTAMIALVPHIALDASAGNIVPPLRFNGLPTGLLPGATTKVLVSLNTDVPALCKYATTSGVSFFAMSSSTVFNTANIGTLHYIETTVSENNIFTYYLRCINESFIENPDDFLISFEIGVIPNASSTPLPPPPPPTPSGPSGSGGGGGNFLKGGDVTIIGRGVPGASLVILKDGKIAKEDQISVLGDFSSTFTSLDRGTYTWGVYLKDPNGSLSSTYNSTIYLIGGTNNMISPVYLSPTIKAATTTVPVGGSISLSGFGIPLVTVQAIMNKQGDPLNGKIVTATTTANGNGSWKLTLPTTGLTKATYEVKVQSLVTSKDQSNFSPTLYIGLGQDPNPDFKNRADLNRDGKVNLVDFSILLFNWKGNDATADINQDGTVNLTDFSIMLSNWTG